MFETTNGNTKYLITYQLDPMKMFVCKLAHIGQIIVKRQVVTCLLLIGSYLQSSQPDQKLSCTVCNM